MCLSLTTAILKLSSLFDHLSPQNMPVSFAGVKTSEKDSEEDAEVHGGWCRGQCDDFEDSDR